MSGATEEKPADGGKKTMMILVVALLVVIVVLAGAVYLLSAKKDDGAASAEEPKKVVKTGELPLFEKLEPFTLNLSGGSGMLQIELQAEIRDAENVALLKAYMPKIRSALILLLSAKTADQLATTEGKTKLKNQIRQVINETVSDSGVDDAVLGISFTSLIVQI